MPSEDLPPLALALGRVPTGLYVVSTVKDGAPLGFVGSFLVQVGFEPPTVCVAIGKGRVHLEAVREAGHFAVSILDEASRNLMGAFFKAYEGGETPFDALATRAAPGGSPILTEALAWLDCRVVGEHETGDHVVVFGQVTDAELLREGEPAFHVRTNGLAY
ncbi:MAG: flavin reductase family protein [Planctomycetota bacterium]|nr:flavin reductase family protein [Planctomycetota bacterium]